MTKVLDEFCAAPTVPQPESDLTFSTGSTRLDALLCGGIKPGTITEIIGKSCSGKTQLCLTAAALAASQDHGVVYLSSDGPSLVRISEILRKRGSTETQSNKATNRITFVESISSEQCTQLLEDVLSDLANLDLCCDLVDPGEGAGSAMVLELIRRLKVVIVDSLALILKPELGGSAGMSNMVKLQRVLRKLAEEADIAVIVVNTFTESREGGLKPSLGKSWYSVSDARIILEQRLTAETEHVETEASSINDLRRSAQADRTDLNATVFTRRSGLYQNSYTSIARGGIIDALP